MTTDLIPAYFYYDGSHFHDIRQIVKSYIIESDIEHSRVLDLGCGSNPISYIIRDSSIRIGIDIDRHGLHAAEHYPDLLILNMDMKAVPVVFQYSHVDIVLLCDSLEHIEYEEALCLITGLKGITKTIMAFIPEGPVGDNPEDQGVHKHKHHWTLENIREAGFSRTYYLRDYHGINSSAFFCVWREGWGEWK